MSEPPPPPSGKGRPPQKDEPDPEGAAGGSHEPQSSSSNSSASEGFLNDLLSKLKMKGSKDKEKVSMDMDVSEEAMTTPDPECPPDTPVKILDEASLTGIKKYIDANKCKNIVVMAGAGISTSAGIPDFRSPGSGLYDKIREKYNLVDPQVMFEIRFFRENPKPFYTLAKDLLPETYEPTPSHHFVRLLNDKGLLLRHYTQNIDGLERKAGIPDDKIVEAHGSFYKSHCLTCKQEYSFEWMKAKIATVEVPKCEKCDSTVKPDVIFFGESLPPRFFMCVEKDMKQADLLIVMGSSLVVQPFASLLDKINDDCPRLLINREKVGSHESMCTPQILQKLGLDNFKALFGKTGFNFSDERNRDVALIGNCDDGVFQVAKELGWEKEFQEVIDASKK